ncbi:MAG: DUF6531 domain-containing protein [Verrucomicrobiota bacterium]|nr:DUF6531 domain-containing protein [Verrucomicrobiota bacterium]
MNTINGNVSVDATDAAVACPGLGLIFERSYNSVLDYTGPMGPRWTHSFNWLLLATNTVFAGVTNSWRILQTGEGRQYYFHAKANGVYENPVDNNWRLTRQGNQYQVALSAGVVLSFDTNGVLQSMADGWQNNLTLTYSNSYPNHLLTKVQHADGQSFAFVYTGGLLSEVKSPSTNPHVSFWYNGQRELTNATRHMSGATQVTAYAYDAAGSFRNHSLTQRVNALGDVFTWEYATNAAGQVTSVAKRSLLSTNLYDTSIAFATNGEYRSTATYTRGATNQVYEHFRHPVLRRVTEIRGPNCASVNWAGAGRGGGMRLTTMETRPTPSFAMVASGRIFGPARCSTANTTRRTARSASRSSPPTPGSTPGTPTGTY